MRGLTNKRNSRELASCPNIRFLHSWYKIIYSVEIYARYMMGNIEIFLSTNYKNTSLIRVRITYQLSFFILDSFSCVIVPAVFFCYCPVIRIDACMISRKMTFSLNFISYHIFAIYVSAASSELPDVCRLIAVSGARLPSFDGLAVSCMKMDRHVKFAITICFQFTSNMFKIDIYLYANTQGLCSCAFAYMWLRYQGLHNLD